MRRSKENLGHLDQSNGESFANGVWNIKKKEFSKVSPTPPAAKIDVNGRLVTDPENLKKLYLDTKSLSLMMNRIKNEVKLHLQK